MSFVFALVPVLLFLAFLFFLDSFKLVTKPNLFICLAGGIIGAIFAYFINSLLLDILNIDYELLSRYIAHYVH